MNAKKGSFIVKATTKRALSMLLVLVMALGLCSVSVFAEANTATITAKNASGAVVGSGYTSLGAAAAAAGSGGTVEISQGDVYYDSRQGISTDNVKLKGMGMNLTTIKASSNFANTLDPDNRKALVTFTGSGIVVEDIGFDGSLYGCSSTFEPDGTPNTQFNVVRVNTGSVTFNDVLITGSKRTLLSVGTSTLSAEVTANNLMCEAVTKTIVDGAIYADVSIVNGTLHLNSGSVVNGFICKDKDVSATQVLDNQTSNHHKLTWTTGFWIFQVTRELTSTTKHFANSYPPNATYSEKSTYSNAINDTQNINEVVSMVNEAIGYLDDGTVTDEDMEIAENLKRALDDAISMVQSPSADLVDARDDLAEKIALVQAS